MFGSDKHLRDYLRRPDSAFWLEILKPPPQSTELDELRRIRIARYALGGAAMIALMYTAITSIALPADRPLFLANLISLSGYACGMWAASLMAHKAAKLWLMTTALLHLTALIIITGTEMISVIYLQILAVLSSILFSRQEKWLRGFFIAAPVTLILFSSLGLHVGIMSLDLLPPGYITATRVFDNMAAAIALLVIFDLFNRQVLGSEIGLVDERNRSERLLYAVLPRKIADQLRGSEKIVAHRHPEVTVLFADVAGFTPWAAGRDPEQVVLLLENIFHRFDQRVASLGAEKIKTIGDAYMVISGAPDPCHNHAQVIAELALHMLDDIRQIGEETGISLDLRIGIHTGPVIAGVIGAMRFSYDVWGDTVNTASRMESHGEPGRIQISADTRALLPSHFQLEHRGRIAIKGKGEMETWWLVGIEEVV